MCLCVSVLLHLCILVRVSTCERACVHACRPVHICAFVFVCLPACLPAYLSACASVCVSACTCRQSGYPVRERECVYGKVRWSLHSLPTYMYVCVCVCVYVCVSMLTLWVFVCCVSECLWCTCDVVVSLGLYVCVSDMYPCVSPWFWRLSVSVVVCLCV